MRWVTLLAGFLMVVASSSASGCGSDAESSSQAKSNLTPLLLKDGELPGYKRSGEPYVQTDASKWASENRGGDDAKRLNALGFVAGAPADLKNANGKAGLTLVERFPSSAAASKELAHATADHPNLKRFPVPGIPIAVGFEAAGSPGGRNIAFTKESTYYLVGHLLDESAPTVEALIATAQRQYQRAAR